MIETAAVIHSELESGIYHLLADYLRFCGVSVYNYAVTEETKIKLTYDFSAVFIDRTALQNVSVSLGSTLRQDGDEGDVSNRLIVIKESSVDWNKQEDDEKNERTSFLLRLVDRLNNTDLLQDNDRDVLSWLAELYVKHEILKNRVILQMFLGTPRFLRAARRHFFEAYLELITDDKAAQWRENPYCWFSVRYLERMLNESCGFLKEDMLLDTEDVVKRIEQMKERYHGHRQYQAKLYFTMAHFYECDFYRQRKCIEPYEKGFKCALDTPFDYYASYRLGRCLEKYRDSWDSAFTYYQKSLKSAPNEYRTAFKVAIYHWKQKKDVEAACDYFLSIDRILHQRYENNVMQPREAEYLYKAWFFMGQMIEENGGTPIDQITARSVEDKKQDILLRVQDMSHQNLCYTQIFGSSGQIDSYDGNGEGHEDVRIALVERIQTVCTL